MFEENSLIHNPLPVKDMAAGMNSLDAALRRAERCMAGSKDLDIQADFCMDNGMEHNGDDLADGDEEGIPSYVNANNQQNSAINRTTHLRNRNRVLKKRNQLQKDLEHALPLASPDQHSILDERSFEYAASFFKKVRERYEKHNTEVFLKFMELMNCVGQNLFSVTDLYHRVLKLFEGSPDLCEEFLLFLSPKQALLCGKFMEHLALTEMTSFVRKLELYFAKQPQHLKKIHSTWARLAETSDLKLESVRSTFLPLLRGNTVLADSFLALLPSESPPESKMTDFDFLICEDLDSEQSGEEEPFERIEVPAEKNDQYGGDNCQCCCHSTSTDQAYINRTMHCRPCGIKFISGKVFMQTEHGLRPVRIDFRGNGTISSNIKRLNADYCNLSRSRPRRGRNSTGGAFKLEESKQNAETDDESGFSSKIKSPRQRSKIPRSLRDKPSSAKSPSLGRTCHRRLVSGKSSSSVSVINDPEAVTAHDLSGEEKLSALDFSVISNVLLTDQDDIEREDLTQKNSVNEVLVEDVQDLEIKEECIINDEAKEMVTDCCINNPGRKSGDDDDVKIESTSCNDISTSDLGVKETASSRDTDNDSNRNVSCTSSECDTEESHDESDQPIWTREEDRTILCTFQSEPDREKVLQIVKAQLPQRTIGQISKRFEVLMSLIQQMR